ncbi:methyl-accepting chemotaxis protein [Haloplanus aerogenes]|uniref:Methyl-accepting chemotaxis protein n=1 Tax=Haloplanus aerogenes TaxID=660522 RepID=A0A3M0DPX1_9EURY|nr:methyl-accepting chemotaxis protein [Haloplanus aerogenes]AZH24504.1 methyl-accepting chemotaxis protein [Haloplanus aerogenes]RMB23848.1 methyl-accepting chemotaxis protein [Haloplanus aerogenes]
MDRIPDLYRRALWGSMERLGVTESIERKIVAAVTIQFGVAAFLAVVPFVLTGIVRAAVTVTLLGGAAVALGNTLLIARRDFVGPIRDLEDAATTIAAGELDAAEVTTHDQHDEIGSLVRAFDGMRTSLETISAQADALANAEFDAAILDEDVPGSFGDDLDRMTDNLRQNTRELEALTEHLERTADEYGEVMAAAADNDLSVRMEPDPESEAMAAIARSFNRMLDDLEETVAEVYAFADTVSDRTVDTSANLDEVAQASEEISDATGDIAVDAEKQRDQLQRIVSEMSDLSATIEEIAASADSVAEVATSTAEKGDEGQQAAVDALDKMDAIETRATETMTQLRELDDRMDRMGDIVATISDIAERTNLLALNASIEAAHSGDDADGFAVVADEVKSLAEEAQAEATDVQEIIDGVQSQTTAAVEEMRRTTDEVADAVETVEAAIDSLDQIAELAHETDEGMREITDATDQQAASTEETVSMIEGIEATSEETATGATAVADAARDQTESLDDVATRVDELAEQADTLLGLLEAFDLSARDGTAAPSSAAAGAD